MAQATRHVTPWVFLLSPAAEPSGHWAENFWPALISWLQHAAVPPFLIPSGATPPTIRNRVWSHPHQNGRFSLSQMSRTELARVMPWREKEPWNGTFYAFDGRSMGKNCIFGDPLKTAKWIIRPKVVTLFLSVVFKAYFQYGENLSAWKCQAGSKEKIKPKSVIRKSFLSFSNDRH